MAALAVRLKYRFRFDDSLDVVAVHGIGGLTGLLATDEAEHAETGYDLGRIGAHITTAAARAVHGPPAAAARSGTARGPASLEAC